MSNWSFGASFTIVVIGVVLWAASAWLCFSNWRRSGRRPAVAALESLRFVLISLLAFTLLQPEFVRKIVRRDRPEIAVLFDRSGSMQTRDLILSNRVVSRTEWLDHARSNEFWQPLTADSQVVLTDFSTASPSDSTNTSPQGTDLEAALSSALQQQSNLKAVLLLTDGDWNIGKSPISAATRYREQDVPVFSVSTGRETPLPDLILESVAAPSYGLFGEQISIPFKIRSHLPREVKAEIVLSSAGREEARRSITLPAQSEFQDAIVWYPRAVGDTQLTLNLPVQPDEALPDNNEKSFRIGVRVETLKVLVVDSLPRWEYRYLRNALARDPGVEMHCLLFHPGLSAGAGRHYLNSFPGTKEMLSRYDVVFLGDVGIGQNELTPNDAELLRGLIEQQGSGLVFLPGRRGRQQTLLTGPLQDLMPVILDERRKDGIALQNESTLVLSALGKDHLLTRFDSDTGRNAEIWQQLPGFFWSAAVEKSRPGSEVLAVHSGLRNAWGRMPLLVTRPAGSGKVLFMGSDSAWRWRRGVEDRFHYRFWSQVVRWMAHQRHLSEREGIRLSFSPEVPEPGATVFLQATVLDQGGFPIERGPVLGKVLAPSGREEHLEFAALEGGWGVFKANFIPSQSGAYTVDVTAPKHNRELETTLTVARSDPEKLGQPVNSELLRELAAITGGATASADSLADVIQKISLLPEPKPIEKRTRLWSEPWWGGMLLALLSVYWIGRKLAGMV